MASFINAGDAVAAAVEIEKRGHGFYVSVAEQASDADVKEFFEFMAREELCHEKIFEAMLKRVGGLSLPAGSTDEEYLVYVSDLLDWHSLFLPQDEKRALAQPFVEAMRFEKDTLLFFLELERMVPESEVHYIRECADAERAHIRMIAQRMAAAR